MKATKFLIAVICLLFVIFFCSILVCGQIFTLDKLPWNFVFAFIGAIVTAIIILIVLNCQSSTEEIKDKKGGFLFDILKICDKCWGAPLILVKNKNEKIGYGINCNYCGTWIYFIIIFIYLFCSFFFIFPSCFIITSHITSLINCFITILAVLNSVTLIIFSLSEEEYLRKKIKKETGKDKNSYELFCSEVEKYSDEKLHFIKDHIEHLLNKSKRNNNEKITTLIFIPLLINIAANDIYPIEGQFSWFSLIRYIFVGVIFIIVYNKLPKTFSIEVLKLTQAKTFIEYALLCRRAEKIE